MYRKIETPFWESEAPEILCTSKNTIRYFPIAGKLLINAPDYRDNKTGELKAGKSSALNLKSLNESPEVAHRLIVILLDCLPPLPEYIDPKEATED